MQEFITELIGIIKKKKPSKEELSIIKTRLSKKYRLKKIPTDIEVLLHAPVRDIGRIRASLLTKPTRTISGVAVCAVMTRPFACPHVKKGIGPCIMCPGGPSSNFGNVPQSYTGKEPATRRAIRNNYDPYLQVMNRIEQHIVQGHFPDKIELIIMGGTFPSFPISYQEGFVTYALKAMNDFSDHFFNAKRFDIVKFKKLFELPGDIDDEKRQKRVQSALLALKNKTINSLEKEQQKNETGNIRCISLVIETRPDYANKKHAFEMLKLGCTKVELGIQTIYDDVLKNIHRGHTVADSIKATRTLKDLGFKINYHMMLGLPKVSEKMDIAALNALFQSPDFQPDMLKLYPCMVMKGTKLYDLWKDKKYRPLTTGKAANLIVKLKKNIPDHVRIMRVQRDIPTFITEAGVDKTNLRQYVDVIMNRKKIRCRCIRCREPKSVIPKRIIFKEKAYNASGGNEFFFSAEDEKKDCILGFCRMRIPSQSLRKEITDESALIRELHVYGKAAQIGKTGKIQHKGIGKALVLMAEDKAKVYFRKKMVVISGIGAREYFRKLGYRKEGPYMVKKL